MFYMLSESILYHWDGFPDETPTVLELVGYKVGNVNCYVLVSPVFSGLPLVLNKECLWLTWTDTHPEQTQRRTRSQASLDTHIL